MASINPHINFNGNAEEAFTFYKSVFGGEFSKIVRFKDIASSEFPVAEKEENKIMHIALPIGKSNMLMANDVPEIFGIEVGRVRIERRQHAVDRRVDQHAVVRPLYVVGAHALEHVAEQVELLVNLGVRRGG